MSAYLLGLATLPALAVAVWLLIDVLIRVMQWLAEKGVTVNFKANREPSRVSDFTLRRDIWFEQQRGPLFTGHWYREWPGDRPCATRWIGIGSPAGRSVMFFRKRDLHTLAATPPATDNPPTEKD